MYDPEKRLRHYFQLVFSDGACFNNGQGDAAKAGLGIVISDVDVDLFWSIAVDDTLDTAPRTNQRAELLAAIEGLKKLELENQNCCSVLGDEINHSSIANEDYRGTYIVVTDSEYVVKGITEWFPQWRVSCHSC